MDAKRELNKKNFIENAENVHGEFDSGQSQDHHDSESSDGQIMEQAPVDADVAPGFGGGNRGSRN